MESLDKNSAKPKFGVACAWLLARLFGSLLALTGLWHAMDLWYASAMFRFDLQQFGQLIKTVVIPIQIAVGIGIVLYPYNRVLNQIAFAILCLFVVYQLVHWLFDGSPCDCLVIARLSPGTMIWIDVAGCAIFLIGVFVSNEHGISEPGRIVFYSTSLLALAIGVVVVAPRLLPSAGRLVVAPNTKYLTDVPADGTIHYRYLNVTNASLNELNLVGGTSNCACTVLVGMPKKLSPFENAMVPIGVRATKASSTNKIQVVFHTDSQFQSSVGCSLFFRSVPIVGGSKK